jgi:hypothetical protein
VSGQFGELLMQSPGGDALEAVDQPRQRHGRGEADEQVDVFGLAVELHQLAAEVAADRPDDLPHPFQMRVGEHRMPVFRHEKFE